MTVIPTRSSFAIVDAVRAIYVRYLLRNVEEDIEHQEKTIAEWKQHRDALRAELCRLGGL